MMEPETYKPLVDTMRKDCRVLESFKIMDYSLLVGIHNIDLAAKEREESLQMADTQTETKVLSFIRSCKQVIVLVTSVHKLSYIVFKIS